ncbi:hypothetical protein OK18_08495 [Chryseobacterium gallinarum]|uniref:VCBS repeat-containing protein n=1 Tax=Chryseobacterium gallinarum TaxID=1324352 RepID=A0A0G3M1Z1_CHRGL|nr:hypothetical protein [Chryseobacterium gallinarum]AKK72655.1 hypothetical protein OK18_08495 [Chryseobacterium gallinarum]
MSLIFDICVEKDQNNRPSSLKIEIIKNSKNFQNITYNPSTWPVIKDSLALTRANYFANDAVINEGVEHFHDFITADFNFDGREDFAILYDFWRQWRTFIFIFFPK